MGLFSSFLPWPFICSAKCQFHLCRSLSDLCLVPQHLPELGAEFPAASWMVLPGCPPSTSDSRSLELASLSPRPSPSHSVVRNERSLQTFLFLSRGHQCPRSCPRQRHLSTSPVPNVPPSVPMAPEAHLPRLFPQPSVSGSPAASRLYLQSLLAGLPT